MRTPHKSPVLADAADVLSDQLRAHMKRLAVLVNPHALTIEKRFEQRLKRMNVDGRVRQTLSAITLGSVAKLLAEGDASGDFIELVEYTGRRLAKFNVPPSVVINALQEYERLLAPVLEHLIPGEYANFRWVREQLQFCVVLTLNNAYYEVREKEARAFYDLFRVELESRNLDELLQRFLATLVEFCRADSAEFCWLGEGADRSGELAAPACWSWKHGRGVLPQRRLLNRKWAAHYRSCWSVPLSDASGLRGVMQFAFAREYEWLPREQELLAAAAERLLKAAEKARLVEDLAKREEQLRTLAERMLQVEEAERRRISRELHDEAGQSLLCVRLQLEMIEQDLPAGAEGVRGRLFEARRETEKTILEIRRLLAALSPAVLEQLGLAAATRQLVSRFRQMYPVRVRLHLSRIQGLPKKLENIVYRLVQECLNNIAKHSNASSIILSASTADGFFRMLVEDDGVGFNVHEALAKKNSFGLSGIRERVTLMGGHFSIESWPAAKATKRGRKGTRIRIDLPVPKEQIEDRSPNLTKVG